MKRKANAATIALIKRWEALRLKAYECPASPRLLPNGTLEHFWTIGWGSTRGVKKGMVITLEEAERRFQADLIEAVSGLERVAPAWLNENQFGALVSFVFNFGLGALVGSRLMTALRSDDELTEEERATIAAAEFKKWKHARDKKGNLVVLPGLVQRRAEERALFETLVTPVKIA